MDVKECIYLIVFPNTKYGYLCSCPEPCEQYIKNAGTCPVIKQMVANFSER